MRWLLALLVYLAALAVVAVAAFFVVIVFAGPHAGLLPHWAEVIVLILGWLAVLVLPALAARKFWSRYGKAAP